MIRTTKAFTKLAITPEIFDTFDIDNNAIPNSIIIPFRKSKRFNKQNKDTYSHLIQNNYKLLNCEHTLFVLIEAQNGHDIFDYDNNYNYYIGTIVNINGESIFLKEDISTTITDIEKDFIQNILLGHMDTLNFLKKKVKVVLEKFDRKVHVSLYSHMLENGEYHSTWESTNHKGVILVDIPDYYADKLDVQIRDMRY